MAIPFQELPIAKIVESPSNPRKDFGKDDLVELTADVKLRGVLQPVLVRPNPNIGGGYELVFGHRRFRAARAAGLEKIPSMVKELADVEVLELQLVENVKRTDLHPLEVAAGYHELHDKHGLSEEEIAKRIGKSLSHVKKTLKLHQLAQPLKKAYRAGELPAGVAQLLARVPTTKLQVEAFEDLRKRQRLDDVHDARHLLEQRYMVELSKAPFDVNDTTLLPPKEASACVSCPKRTGAQPELFNVDAKAKDVCTDVGCYQAKTQAWWARESKKAKDEGGPKFLSATESKKIFPYEHMTSPHGSEYVERSAQCYEDADYRSYKALLGKEGKAVEVLALHPHTGQVVELYSKAGMAPALKAAAKIKTRKSSTRSSAAPRQTKEDKAKRAKAEELALIRARAVQLAFGVAVGKIETQPLKYVDRLIERTVYSLVTMHEHESELLTRRGWKSSNLKKEIPKLSTAQLRGLLFEALFNNQMFTEVFLGGYDKLTEEIFEAVDVDLKEMEAAARAELEAKLQADLGAKGKKTSKKFPLGTGLAEKCTKCGQIFGEHAGQSCPKPKGKASGVCRKCGCTWEKPCPDSCAWTDDSETLCTSCVGPGLKGEAAA